MRCAEFAARWNAVLDLRACPESDAELRLHLESCPACRAAQAGFELVCDVLMAEQPEFLRAASFEPDFSAGGEKDDLAQRSAGRPGRLCAGQSRGAADFSVSAAGGPRRRDRRGRGHLAGHVSVGRLAAGGAASGGGSACRPLRRRRRCPVGCPSGGRTVRSRTVCSRRRGSCSAGGSAEFTPAVRFSGPRLWLTASVRWRSASTAWPRGPAQWPWIRARNWPRSCGGCPMWPSSWPAMAAAIWLRPASRC